MEVLSDGMTGKDISEVFQRYTLFKKVQIEYREYLEMCENMQ